MTDVVVYTTHPLMDWARWTNLDGVVGDEATGALIKNSETIYWPSGQPKYASGAISIRKIHRNDYIPQGVTFKCPDHTTHALGGLADGDDSASYEDISFALFCVGPGHSGDGSLPQLYVIEHGAPMVDQSLGIYSATDVLEVRVVGTQVSYLKNGIVLHNPTQVPQFPMTIDTSLLQEGDELDDVNFMTVATSQAIHPTPAPILT